MLLIGSFPILSSLFDEEIRRKIGHRSSTVPDDRAFNKSFRGRATAGEKTDATLV